jgi:hypothetical protein
MYGKAIADFVVSLDGFFDAGMLQQALKAKAEEKARAQVATQRRSVGKKLRLNEY